MLKCVVPGCNNISNTKSNLEFYSFPIKKKPLCKAWINVIKKKNWTPTESSKVCSDHFTLEKFDVSLVNGEIVKILKQDAIPNHMLPKTDCIYHRDQFCIFCCVLGCKINSKNSPETTFHSLPLKHTLTICNCIRQICSRQPDLDLENNLKICNQHFQKNIKPDYAANTQIITGDIEFPLRIQPTPGKTNQISSDSKKPTIEKCIKVVRTQETSNIYVIEMTSAVTNNETNNLNLQRITQKTVPENKMLLTLKKNSNPVSSNNAKVRRPNLFSRCNTPFRVDESLFDIEPQNSGSSNSVPTDIDPVIVNKSLPEKEPQILGISKPVRNCNSPFRVDESLIDKEPQNSGSSNSIRTGNAPLIVKKKTLLEKKPQNSGGSSNSVHTGNAPLIVNKSHLEKKPQNSGISKPVLNCNTPFRVDESLFDKESQKSGGSFNSVRTGNAPLTVNKSHLEKKPQNSGISKPVRTCNTPFRVDESLFDKESQKSGNSNSIRTDKAPFRVDESLFKKEPQNSDDNCINLDTLLCVNSKENYIHDIQAICRICLKRSTEKMIPISKKSFFGNVCIYDMLITCTRTTVTFESNFPKQICLSCLKNMKKSYEFLKCCDNSTKFLDRFVNKQQALATECLNIEHNYNKEIKEEVVVEEEEEETPDEENNFDIYEDQSETTQQSTDPEITKRKANDDPTLLSIVPENKKRKANNDNNVEPTLQPIVPEIKKRKTNNDHNNADTTFQSIVLEVEKRTDDDGNNVDVTLRSLVPKIEKIQTTNDDNSVDATLKSNVPKIEKRQTNNDDTTMNTTLQSNVPEIEKRKEDNKKVDTTWQPVATNIRERKILKKDLPIELLNKVKNKSIIKADETIPTSIIDKIKKKSTIQLDGKSYILAKAFTCKKCREIFFVKNKLDTHPCRGETNQTPDKQSSNNQQCAKCKKIFKDLSEFKSHNCNPIATKELQKCDNCTKYFTTKQYLNNHKNVCYKIKMYKCKVCNDIVYSSYNDFISHLKSQHFTKIETGVTLYKCGICFAEFQTHYSYAKHFKIHTIRPLTFYKCSKCNTVFSKLASFNAHMKTHKKMAKVIQCRRCIIEFETLKELNEHKLTAHPSIQKFVTCMICMRRMTTIQYTAHKKVHVQERNHCCEYCGNRFKTGGMLRQHIRNVHLNIKPFSCDICDRKFSFRVKMLIHRAIHFEEKKYMCEKCGASFKQQTPLHTHIKLNRCFKTKFRKKEHPCSKCSSIFETRRLLIAHRQTEHPNAKKGSGPKKFKCQVCDIICDSKSALINHEFIHGDKDYFCSVCKKAFFTNEALYQHAKRHNLDKNFNCEQCEKKFASPATLKLHMMVHTGEKEYKCNYCPKTFTQPSHLCRHHKVHTGDKPFQCPHCDRSFAEKGNLTVHIRTHTGERPYRCRFCDSAFYDSSSAKKHMQFKHKENMPVLD